ncbi:hypothetical protein PC9H_002668 [Pleurotus ostreatus]|uniref:G domain-containing protein n=1 Tax=Pleurotus ostreatus TaxID=5322 RepID=A0A8H6ZH49_PLEOS|nr:uncharacterized protein PC9H_002668 [Pleurotus ostreatus]KAF7416402.1 hypothetical protein PC9H_002668 [Pleurotus ostreatus]KAJ8689312.1 hypothetical protein PTI98_013345 [Pleurotus ostreatus]
MLYIRAGYIKEKFNSSVYNDPLEAMGNIFGKGVTKDDDVIVLLGPTGAGKSTFLNSALGEDVARVGTTLSSCTSEVQIVKCPIPGARRQVALVDTPAFNHGNVKIADIEKMIKKGLKEMYKRQIKVAGILYVHRITDVRMTENPIRHLDTFHELCGGNQPAHKVILTTTMWANIDEETGGKRERELKDGCWKPMASQGSRVMRYHDTSESARDIIRTLVG